MANGNGCAAKGQHICNVIILFQGDRLAPKPDQAFDIKFISWHGRILRLTPFPGDAGGFKNNNFPARWFSEIVCHPVHEQVVAGVDLEVHHIIALVKSRARTNASPAGQACSP